LGPLGCSEFYEIYSDPPGPLQREAIVEPLSTGVRVIDALLTCGKGQRLGILGGSGVGKSTLLGAMARSSSADVNVIALIGERNREVRAFLEETLGLEGLKKSVVVSATSTVQRRCACAPPSWPRPSPTISAIKAKTCC